KLASKMYVAIVSLPGMWTLSLSRPRSIECKYNSFDHFVGAQQNRCWRHPGHTMFARVKFGSALVGLVCIAVGCMNGAASAVTAEVAKKCAALTAKAYPPRAPGNPAAGLAKGTWPIGATWTITSPSRRSDFQHTLSPDQRGSALVETVKVQEVKGVVHHPEDWPTSTL